MPCSNAAKTQNPLKFVRMPQTPEPISAVSGPKFTIWVPIQHNVAWAKVYLHTKWYPDPSSPLAIIDTGQNVEGHHASLHTGGAGSPCKTMSPGLRHTSVPSGILIHQAIRPQQTWVEKWGEAAVPLFSCRKFYRYHSLQMISAIGGGHCGRNIACWK